MPPAARTSTRPISEPLRAAQQPRHADHSGDDRARQRRDHVAPVLNFERQRRRVQQDQRRRPDQRQRQQQRLARARGSSSQIGDHAGDQQKLSARRQRRQHIAEPPQIAAGRDSGALSARFAAAVFGSSPPVTRRLKIRYGASTMPKQTTAAPPQTIRLRQVMFGRTISSASPIKPGQQHAFRARQRRQPRRDPEDRAAQDDQRAIVCAARLQLAPRQPDQQQREQAEDHRLHARSRRPDQMPCQHQRQPGRQRHELATIRQHRSASRAPIIPVSASASAPSPCVHRRNGDVELVARPTAPPCTAAKSRPRSPTPGRNAHSPYCARLRP